MIPFEQIKLTQLLLLLEGGKHPSTGKHPTIVIPKKNELYLNRTVIILDQAKIRKKEQLPDMYQNKT